MEWLWWTQRWMCVRWLNEDVSQILSFLRCCKRCENSEIGRLHVRSRRDSSGTETWPLIYRQSSSHNWLVCSLKILTFISLWVIFSKRNVRKGWFKNWSSGVESEFIKINSHEVNEDSEVRNSLLDLKWSGSDKLDWEKKIELFYSLKM